MTKRRYFKTSEQYLRFLSKYKDTINVDRVYFTDKYCVVVYTYR